MYFSGRINHPVDYRLLHWKDLRAFQNHLQPSTKLS